MKSFKVLLSVFAAVFFVGCGGFPALSVPQRAVLDNANASKSVFINEINDKREFIDLKTIKVAKGEYKSSHQAIKDKKPSEISDELKDKTYGSSFGYKPTLYLNKDSSVKQLVKTSTLLSFANNGYKVIYDQKDILSNTLVLNVDIDRFWLWGYMGFWVCPTTMEISVNLHSKDFNKLISTKHTRNNQSIRLHVVEVMVNEGLDRYEKALDEFIKSDFK